MADGSNAQPLPGLTRAPRSIDFDLAERELAVAEIISRLREGEALNAICKESHLPNDWTVRAWADADADLAVELARARARGFDLIAEDTVQIADGLKPVVTADGTVLANDVQRDKLRVDARFRVLAKWDPKRYGEALQMRMADADGGKLDTAPMVRELLALVRPADGAQALLVEGSATVVAPHSKEPPADR